MSEIVGQSSPQVVFHLASLVLGDHESDDVSALVSSNILLGTQLLEAMANNGIKYLINTGTYWEHYENKKYSPVNLYAATKHAFQDILQYYSEAKGINAITLKLFDPYGPNDPRPKLLNLLVKITKTGEKLAMSPGEQKIDFVHIDDVVQAYIVAAQRLLEGEDAEHEVYGVASGHPITLKELVKIVEEVTKKKLNIEWGGRHYRGREVMWPWNGYKPLPMWKPKTRLGDGILSLFHRLH